MTVESASESSEWARICRPRDPRERLLALLVQARGRREAARGLPGNRALLRGGEERNHAESRRPSRREKFKRVIRSEARGVATSSPTTPRPPIWRPRRRGGRCATPARGQEEIDLVLVHSLPPDQLMPSNAPALQAKLGLVNATAWSLDVSSASFLAQLVAATALVRSGVYRRVLLVLSQAASRVLDYSTPGSRRSATAPPRWWSASSRRATAISATGCAPMARCVDGVVFATVIDGQAHRRWGRVIAGPSASRPSTSTWASPPGCARPRSAARPASGRWAPPASPSTTSRSTSAIRACAGLVDACRRALAGSRSSTPSTPSRRSPTSAPSMVPSTSSAPHHAGGLRDGDVVLLYSPGAGFHARVTPLQMARAGCEGETTRRIA